MSTGYGYFQRMYVEEDPWAFATSAYEQHKYAVTIACLPRERYRRVFEPGCSIGVLTEQLADRADEVVVVDLHPRPLEQARNRLRRHGNVQIEQMVVPGEWPAGTFDLVVLSEVAYYMDDDDHRALVERVVSSLEPGGDLALVHWRGETDYPQSGDQVHERWRADPRFEVVGSHAETRFLVDILRASGLPGASR